ncbi:MAG: ATP-binding protein [Patescibacteria group bacterium]
MSIDLIKLLFLILGAALTSIIAFFVYQSDRKRTQNRFFVAMSFFGILWLLFAYFSVVDADLTRAAIWAKLNFASVTIFIILSYFFVINFFKKTKTTRAVDYAIVAFGTVLLFTVTFSRLIIDSTSSETWGNQINYGPLWLCYVLAISLIGGYSVFILLQKYKDLDTEGKSKLKYFLVGVFLFFLGNLIFNALINLIVDSNKFDSFGDYSILIFLGFTAYAIIKDKLFDIKLIATQIIVIALSVSLLIEVFISNTLSEGAIKAIIWGLATYGGYLLIKSVQVEIKQREDLAVLAKKLEKANDDLKKMDQLKDDFISMASHELNTPVSAIKGYMSMILEEGLGGKIPDQVRSYLEKVYSSSQRLASMIKDLLNVSRIESGRIHLIYEQKPIEELIDQAIGEIMSKAKEANHTLVFNKPEKALPLTWFDVTRIMEILINIIGNSIKYTDPGGKIEVSASAEDKLITVAIKDNGRGIPKEKQDQVFSKFTQVDVLKDEVKGTGLGMYISKEFINLHKGKIWFESDGENKGTTFYFSLPILKEKPLDPHEGEGAVLH